MHSLILMLKLYEDVWLLLLHIQVNTHFITLRELPLKSAID